MEEGKGAVLTGCYDSEGTVGTEINRVDGFTMAHDLTN